MATNLYKKLGQRQNGIILWFMILACLPIQVPIFKAHYTPFLYQLGSNFECKMAKKNMQWMSLLATPISVVPLFAMMQIQSQSQSQKQSSKSPELQKKLCNPKLGLPFQEQTETSMLMCTSLRCKFL